MKGVSVAMACYNGERFIEAQLESIRAQTLPPAEVVVSDDHSTDRTGVIVRAFAQRAPFPVRLISNPKGQRSVVENFFNAFSACRHPLIAYCDQDDVWVPHKLERCVPRFRKESVRLVVHASRVVDERLNDLGFSMPSAQKTRVIKFPSYIDQLHAFGHQMVFDARLLPLMAQLYRIAPPGLLRIAKCFDEMVPLGAGMTGDIEVIGEDLTWFRRHSGSCTLAGKEKLSRSLRSKVARKRSEISGLAAELEAWALLLERSAQFGKPRPDYLDFIQRRARRALARARIYEAHSVASRFRALVTLLCQSGYSALPTNPGFGSKALLHDVVATIFGGKRAL